MEEKECKLLEFFKNVLRGVAIGVAFIIPGFSGGSVAAILGIYEKLVGAIADVFRHFLKSMAYLLPILLGMLIGIAALIYPIQWGLNHYPVPTVTLFVGLTVGALPSFAGKLKGEVKTGHWFALVIPFLVTLSLCVLPIGADVDLFSLSVGGYLLLILVGIMGSAALVVPGISGSMLLLIFGYYNPVVSLVTENLLKGNQVGQCVLVLLFLLAGVIIGFFGISVLMKYLLKKFPRGTYFAIFGFVLGSIPVVYTSTMRGAGEALVALYSSPWYWVAAVAMLLLGIAVSYLLTRYAKQKSGKTGGIAENNQENSNQENQT